MNASLFDAAQFFAQWRRRKGAAERRRLARRLLARQRRRLIACGAVVSHAFSDRPVRTSEQIRVRRVGRHAKKLRQRVRQRQLIAARSGLPELVRRSTRAASREAAGAARAAKGRNSEAGVAHSSPSGAPSWNHRSEKSNCLPAVGGKPRSNQYPNSPREVSSG